MRKGQRTGRTPAIAPKEVDEAWNGKFSSPVPEKIYQNILDILKENGDLDNTMVTAKFGFDARTCAGLFSSMVRHNLIKEWSKRTINGKKVQVYVAYNSRKPAPPDPAPKVSKTDEVIAMIEEFLDDGEEIYVAQMVVRLELDRNFLSAVFNKMVKQKVITPIGKRCIDGIWHTFYHSYDKKPKQASMFSSFQVARDGLVAALFGNENRDSEAAWAF